MSVSAHTYTASVGGVTLAIKDGSVKMSEAWAPHVQAAVSIATRDEALYELLDPRVSPRVVVTATSSEGSSKTWDLGLRERTIDHANGDVYLELASDEALLQDDALVAATADTSALTYQDSLRSIINNVVLDRIGAALEPGSADSPFRVLTDTENILVNSGYRSSIAGWVFNNGTYGTPNRIATTSPPEPGIQWSAQVSGLTAGTARGIFNQGGEIGGVPAYVTVTPGDTLNGRIWVRTNQAINVALSYEFSTSAAVAAGAVTGTTTAVPANTWTLVRSSAVVPPTAARLGIYCYAVGSTAGGLNFEVCGAVVTDNGVVPQGFFDGDTTDTTEYSYSWDGVANASASTRTALIDRSPDTLTWEPGVTAWDFVQPIFQTVGMRLFCDEERKWHLVDTEYMAPGYTLLTEGMNITDATDTISRNNSGEWYDAVIVPYRWRDSETTEEMIAYDLAGDPGYTKPLVIEIDRPYPGPGFAAYALSKAQGKGRTLVVSAISDYSVTPTQAVTTTLPLTPIQTGVVVAVSWDFGNDEMGVETRGLTDTPTTAWTLLAPGESWNDSPISASWTSETI